MIYYEVAGIYAFTHYGEALSFARRIGSSVRVRRTYNPFKLIWASI